MLNTICMLYKHYLSYFNACYLYNILLICTLYCLKESPIWSAVICFVGYLDKIYHFTHVVYILLNSFVQIMLNSHCIENDYTTVHFKAHKKEWLRLLLGIHSKSTCNTKDLETQEGNKRHHKLPRHTTAQIIGW